MSNWRKAILNGCVQVNFDLPITNGERLRNY